MQAAGTALATSYMRTLIVAGALANGVDVAPVALSLGVLLGVSIHLQQQQKIQGMDSL
jgi:hypothetical protein